MILFWLVTCYHTPTLHNNAEKPTVIWFFTQILIESTVLGGQMIYDSKKDDLLCFLSPILVSSIHCCLSDLPGWERHYSRFFSSNVILMSVQLNNNWEENPSWSAFWKKWDFSRKWCTGIIWCTSIIYHMMHWHHMMLVHHMLLMSYIWC